MSTPVVSPGPVLHRYGIAVRPPAGWSARLYLRAGGAGERTNPTLQLATVPIPPDPGDYGSAVAAVLRPDDILVVLTEFSAPAAATALFAHRGLPTPAATDFSPAALQCTMPGQSGYQRFFTWQGRPWSLYVVLGSHRSRHALVPRVRDLLAGVSADQAHTLPQVRR